MEPALFQPGRPMAARTTDTAVQAVVLEPAALRRTARLQYGDEALQVRFDGPRPATPTLGSFWRTSAELAVQYARQGVLDEPLLRASVYRLLAVAVLESFRLVGDRPRLRASSARRLQAYRQGAEFLEAFASLPITIDDAASAAGVPTAELVLAFRANTDGNESPAAYLRRVRLEAAHRELALADPRQRGIVAAIAARWGFPSRKALTRQHRAAYGTVPGDVVTGRGEA
jgi:AraC-like DNA-binding protein